MLAEHCFVEPCQCVLSSSVRPCQCLPLTQMRVIVDHVMSDVKTVAPPPHMSLEELRMAYQPVGCWAPTCVLALVIN